MPRKARITVPGAIHHIMSRGNEGKQIFLSNEDRLFFLNNLELQLQKAGYLLYGWCLMDNHYHLLLRVNEFPLGIFMRQVNGRYAQYFRKKSRTRGYFFQDRYKSIVSQDQYYIEQMVRYIHLNPVRAGICKTIEELDTYPWCGHAVIIGRRAWGIQNTHDVLKCFAKQEDDALEHYRSFMKEGLKNEPMIHTILRQNNHDKENIHHTGCWVIGNDEFVRRALSADTKRRARLKEYARKNSMLETIALEVSKCYGLSNGEIKIRGRNNAQSAARKFFAFVCNREYQFPVCEIARYLNISSQSVSNLVNEGGKIKKSFQL